MVNMAKQNMICSFLAKLTEQLLCMLVPTGPEVQAEAAVMKIQDSGSMFHLPMKGLGAY